MGIIKIGSYFNSSAKLSVKMEKSAENLHNCISHFTRCYQLIISVHIIRPVQIISNEFYSNVVLIYFLNIFQSKFSDLREVFHTVTVIE